MGIAEIVVVADAGPLIHLHEINALAWLNHFSAMHIPNTVWEESTRGGRVPADRRAALSHLVRHSRRGLSYKSRISAPPRWRNRVLTCELRAKIEY